MSKYQQTVFISLPVSDLAKSTAFYQAIGFTLNKSCSDQSMAFMVLSETFSIALIAHDKWKELTTRDIPDARKSAQFGIMLSSESKSAVDNWVTKGSQAGGKADPNPVEDFDFMYGRGLEDPDGHILESKWIDMSAMPQANT